MQGRRDSNPRPTVLETAALPTELRPWVRCGIVASAFRHPFAVKSQRKVLGALFILLACGFAGIAAAALASGATASVRILIAVAAASLAIWLGSLAARALR
jgi:hypothetical protein